MKFITITGIDKSGKTTLIKQIIQKLLENIEPERILYFTKGTHVLNMVWKN